MENQLQLQDAILDKLISLFEGIGEDVWFQIGYFIKELEKTSQFSDINPALDALSDLEYVQIEQTDVSKPKRIKISRAGRAFYTAGHRFFEHVPASDRIVSIDHNSPLVAEIDGNLKDLASAIATSNDVGQLSADEIVAARAELNALRGLWDGAKIRAEQFVEMANRSLSWIAEKAAGAAIGELAKRTLEMILRFIF